MKRWVVVVRPLVVSWCYATAGCASSTISLSAAPWVKPPESSYIGRPLVRLGSEMGDSKGPWNRELIEVDFSVNRRNHYRLQL